jgi:hypothetical protein
MLICNYVIGFELNHVAEKCYLPRVYYLCLCECYNLGRIEYTYTSRTQNLCVSFYCYKFNRFL